MSSSQRVRKTTSPVKQGPMRATIPMSSLLRNSNNLRKSPILSPTTGWRCRISPDTSSSGQRSPGSITYKGTTTNRNTTTIHLKHAKNIFKNPIIIRTKKNNKTHKKCYTPRYTTTKLFPHQILFTPYWFFIVTIRTKKSITIH